jgi:hypothetical protein
MMGAVLAGFQPGSPDIQFRSQPLLVSEKPLDLEDESALDPELGAEPPAFIPMKATPRPSVITMEVFEDRLRRWFEVIAAEDTIPG